MENKTSMNNFGSHKSITSTLNDIETMGYIQCVTCGKVIGHLYEWATELRASNFSEMEIYEKFGLKRTCCRYHLSSGFKMPMVKYLDETVRLDLEEENTHMNESNENLEKVASIKNRLSKMKSQTLVNQTIQDVRHVERPNVKRNPFFVAT